VTGKGVPWLAWFALDFIENVYVNLAVESVVEGIVEGIS